MKKPHDPKKRILADHKKEGKKLIPPYIAALGRPDYISWVDTIIPEVVWIGLLHEKFGQQEGIELALSLAQAAERATEKKEHSFFAAASDYEKLSTTQKAALIADLTASKKFDKIQAALSPLFQFYPSCPLNFLSPETNAGKSSAALQNLKQILFGLFDKELRQTVFVQATIVYLAFVLDRLKVREGLTLAQFPEVEKYLDTEMSRRVAAAIRSTVIGFFKSDKSVWPVEFWNRGMEIENCIFTKYE